jgi:hypothetical protein
MSTPIFDQLLREMAQRAEPRAPTTPPPEEDPAQPPPDPAHAGARRRHRAE